MNSSILSALIKGHFVEDVAGAPRCHKQFSAECLSFGAVVKVATMGIEHWTPLQRAHIPGCVYCQKLIAMHWRLAGPTGCPDAGLRAKYAAGILPELETAMSIHLESDACEHCKARPPLISSDRTGLIWQRAQRCSHTAPQDREYVDRVAQGYRKRWDRPSRFRTPIFSPQRRQMFSNVTLGDSDLVSVLPIESLGGAASGPPLTAEVLEAGKLTRDGHFRMKLRLKGDEVLSHESKSLFCTLIDEEARLSFETVVRCGVASFDAEGLPGLTADVFPESYAFAFYLLSPLTAEA